MLLEYDEADRVWVTYVPALNFLSTYGDTREEALEQTREAILGYIEASAAEGEPVSTSGPLEVVELEVATP